MVKQINRNIEKVQRKSKRNGSARNLKKNHAQGLE